MQVLGAGWGDWDARVGEGVAALSQRGAMDMVMGGKAKCAQVPTPREFVGKLVDAAGITLPGAIPRKGVAVATRKKLPTRRVKR